MGLLSSPHLGSYNTVSLPTTSPPRKMPFSPYSGYLSMPGHFPIPSPPESPFTLLRLQKLALGLHSSPPQPQTPTMFCPPKGFRAQLVGKRKTATKTWVFILSREADCGGRYISWLICCSQTTSPVGEGPTKFSLSLASRVSPTHAHSSLEDSNRC